MTMLFSIELFRLQIQVKRITSTLRSIFVGGNVSIHSFFAGCFLRWRSWEAVSDARPFLFIPKHSIWGVLGALLYLWTRNYVIIWVRALRDLISSDWFHAVNHSEAAPPPTPTDLFELLPCLMTNYSSHPGSAPPLENPSWDLIFNLERFFKWTWNFASLLVVD